jgi:hypothetical protein
MSLEAITAVYRYSADHKTPLALIASKNQIDHSGGYVENWTTEQFMTAIGVYRSAWPKAQVSICRDHCGPGFNGEYDLADTYLTLAADLDAGFDYIHFDFSKMIGSREVRIEATQKAIEWALTRKPDLKIEIGTDENSLDLMPFDDLVTDVTIFDQLFDIAYYVVKTGSLITETRQIGALQTEYVDRVHRFLSCYGMRLKEHNADYLTPAEIQARTPSVDCMNIAPQLGVVQTDTVLALCEKHCVDYLPWLQAIWDSRKWEKWISNPPTMLAACRTAGHYTFTSPEYRCIIQELRGRMKGESPTHTIITRLMEVIETYASNRL